MLSHAVGYRRLPLPLPSSSLDALPVANQTQKRRRR